VLETGVQFLRGVSVSFLSYQFILPWWGIAIPLAVNIQMTAYFAVTSIVLSYIIRRMFDAKVRSKMSGGGVRPYVGSIQSLRRVGTVPEVLLGEHKDVDAEGTGDRPGERPVRSRTQRYGFAVSKEDTEFRK